MKVRPGRRILRWSAAAMVAATLAACGSIGSSNDYEGADGAYALWEPDERAEPIEANGTTYSGEEIDLSELRGAPVVINTWYAACPPCRAEAADLVELAGQHDEVTFLGLNTRDDAAAAEAFERTFGMTYGSVHDEDGSFLAALAGTVPLKAVPTTLVLDREGRPAARYLGQIDPGVLDGILSDLEAE